MFNKDRILFLALKVLVLINKSVNHNNIIEYKERFDLLIGSYNIKLGYYNLLK